MDTARVADRLAELYRRREFTLARAELFAPAARGLAPEVARRDRGSSLGPARRSAPLRLSSLMEQVHVIDVDEPLVAGRCFALTMALDSTMAGRGGRPIEGLCGYYRVAGDKIVSERLFFSEGA